MSEKVKKSKITYKVLLKENVHCFLFLLYWKPNTNNDHDVHVLLFVSLYIGKAAWALVHLEDVEKECFAAFIGLAHDPSLRRC
jgi:hypothetical protein